MIGVDVVDLKDPLLQQRNKRALRLIKNNEDVLIEHEHIFWLLWSAKEAIFKCNRELLYFNPTEIPVIISNQGDQFSFSSGIITGTFTITEDYIAAACSSSTAPYAINIYREVTTKTRSLIHNFFLENEKAVSVGKDADGLPVLMPSRDILSISHHGGFKAFGYPAKVLE